VLPVVLGSILVSGHLQPGPETQGGSSEPWPTPNFRIFFTVNLRNISYIYYLFDNFLSQLGSTLLFEGESSL
jgi:hypothetical protein